MKLVACDRNLKTVLKSRLDGPFVEMDRKDFQQLRAALHVNLNGLEEAHTGFCDGTSRISEP